MTASGSENSRERLKVAMVAPSLRYVGGQAVQAELLMRLWQGDPEVDVSFIGVDPPLPRLLSWAERIPGVRTILREPIYFFDLWRGLKDVDGIVGENHGTGANFVGEIGGGGERGTIADAVGGGTFTRHQAEAGAFGSLWRNGNAGSSGIEQKFDGALVVEAEADAEAAGAGGPVHDADEFHARCDVRADQAAEFAVAEGLVAGDVSAQVLSLFAGRDVGGEQVFQSFDVGGAVQGVREGETKVGVFEI